MSLTQKEKDVIHERVENMTSIERRKRLKGFVKEYVIKNVIVHAILATYVLGLMYLNETHDLSAVVSTLLIGAGIFWIYVCMLFFQALLFFRTANKLATCFDKGVQRGVDYVEELSDED
tara:strand:- start:577 stop:933 length:357 start_codon:yes stop_codon:yes gene_type:complete